MWAGSWRGAAAAALLMVAGGAGAADAHPAPAHGAATHAAPAPAPTPPHSVDNPSTAHPAPAAHASPAPKAHRSVKKRHSAKPHAAVKHQADNHGAAAQGADAGHGGGSAQGSELQQVSGVVSSILSANQGYMRSHGPAYFARFANHQTPRATVITCSDSRVQTNALHPDAVNDLFMVRDIGNQLSTAEGSVEYGVRHLHTPLLLIIGHSVCGAIKAAADDFSKLEPAIKKELNTIAIPKGIDVTDGVLLNVNNQVEAAMLKFSGEIEQGHLAVIGAFYDFRNDLKQGAGKLIVTNVNGESEPNKIRQLIQRREFFKYPFMDSVRQ